MELLSLERPVHYHYLIVKITKKQMVEPDELVRNENSINDQKTSEIYIVKGHNKEFEEMIPLSRCMPNTSDHIFLCTAGVFMLYEKYYTLDQLVFTCPDEEGKKQQEFKGERIAEELQKKNQHSSLYPAFLLVVLTKNLKMYYLNMDQYLILRQEDQDNQLTKMAIYDKIYG